MSSTGYIIIKTKNRKEIGTELSWPLVLSSYIRLTLSSSYFTFHFVAVRRIYDENDSGHLASRSLSFLTSVPSLLSPLVTTAPLRVAYAPRGG